GGYGWALGATVGRAPGQTLERGFAAAPRAPVVAAWISLLKALVGRLRVQPEAAAPGAPPFLASGRRRRLRPPPPPARPAAPAPRRCPAAAEPAVAARAPGHAPLHRLERPLQVGVAALAGPAAGVERHDQVVADARLFPRVPLQVHHAAARSVEPDPAAVP